MQLTRFSDLGLRVLMYLTQHDRVEPVTSAEVATQFDVPLNHIIKVVHRLGKLGWVETLRGRNGGLRLAIEPSQLRLGTVVRELEGADQLVDCHEPPCVLRSGCQLKSVLDAGLDAFYATLDKHTLADVCKRRTGELLIALHRRRPTATV
ncbi:MAG: Rrf2 family transcriptional regulator [Polyangiales bacterium]